MQNSVPLSPHFDIPSNIPSLRFEENTPIGISGNSPAFRTSEQLLENPLTTGEVQGK